MKQQPTSEDLINKVNMECKVLKYQLKRIVCGEEDSHITLAHDVPLWQDVIKGTHMFYKISTKGVQSQGRVLISYA